MSTVEKADFSHRRYLCTDSALSAHRSRGTVGLRMNPGKQSDKQGARKQLRISGVTMHTSLSHVLSTTEHQLLLHMA